MNRTMMRRRVITVVLSFLLVFACMPVFGQNAYAASAKPGKAKITSVSAKANTVTVKWNKTKNAKKYKVFVQTGADGWKYWKSVKVSKKNKKKYSDKLKYKLRKSGKKYKVYIKNNPYKLITTTTALSYTYSGQYSTSYTFAVRAYKGKKAGAYSASKSIKTGANPQSDTAADVPGADNQGGGASAEAGAGGSGETPTTPTVTVPGKVTNVQATVSNYEDRFKIKLTWSAASGATGYDIYRCTVLKLKSTPYQKIKSDLISCSYSVATSDINTTFKYKIVPKNSAGSGECVEVKCTTPAQLPTINDGEYSSSSTTAWNQYLNEMFGYYKAELNKRGVSISSTNKADEFQKLQAIIQVMHDYVGYSEMPTYDYSNFPTGRENWYYNDETCTSGAYYNGKDYIPTIKFYASCEIIAATEEYLAEKAGLDVYCLGEYSSSHTYAMICANYMWYNADPAIYMAPGCNGLNYSQYGWRDPSKFAESKLRCKMNGKTIEINKMFKLRNVFYGLGDSVGSNGGLSFDGKYGTALSIGIDPDHATYVSSDESILSFDEANGICTFHKAGEVYVTITYDNLKSSTSSEIPSITTTIRLIVEE